VSYRQTLYTPIVTLWAWMSQVLDSDKFKQCRQPNYCLLATAGETVPSADTGAYSKARKRIPDSAQPLLKQTADAFKWR